MTKVFEHKQIDNAAYVELTDTIKTKGEDLFALIDSIKMLTTPHDLKVHRLTAIALTNLETSIMYATKSISRLP